MRLTAERQRDDLITPCREMDELKAQGEPDPAAWFGSEATHMSTGSSARETRVPGITLAAC